METGTRADLIGIFENTMERCGSDETLKKAVASSVERQTVTFEKDPVPEPAPRFTTPANCVVSTRRSFEAAGPYSREGRKTCVLNFASFVTPGGGVTRGAGAQEESLCRNSTLYPALTADTAAPFYDAHNAAIAAGVSTRKNTHDCIYTPDIRVICDDSFFAAPLPEKEWYTVDVITCAAPDQRYDGERTYCPSDRELYDVFYERFCRIYDIAALHQADAVITGAFGCGAFGNPPEVVARAAKAATAKYLYHFSDIEFAIAGRYGAGPNYFAFRDILGIPEAGPVTE